MKRLLIISSPNRASEDKRLEALATFLGVTTEVFPFQSGGTSPHSLLNQVRPGPCSLAIHLETLSQLYRTLNLKITFLQLLRNRFSEILVFGDSATTETNDALEALTGGTIRRLTLQPLRPVQYALPQEAKELSAQLAGQSLLTSQMHPAPAFEIQSGCGLAETIMTANDRPTFVRLKSSTGEIFLFAGQMPDIDKPLGRDCCLGDDSIPLLPLLIFLRHCFPQSCWRNDGFTARLIIDDPLLTKRYGALDFATLKASIQRLGYGASIAFIPWNHWRSSRRTAARILSPDSNLSICVHGCDHTNHEFQLGSAAILEQKAALGIQRMVKHRERVGVPFEDVMVFPQGQFSKAAIPALRSANYLAAVNSTCIPTDYQPDELTIADFLWPAVIRFDGFPIFQRHYPRRTFDFALDLFLGKPALLVEHHEHFRDHCKGIGEFVTALKEIEPSLSWIGLSEQLMRSNLRRRSENGSIEMRFFTRRFHFMPKESEAGRYRLYKFEPNPDTIDHVLIDGERVAFDFENQDLKFDVQSVPGQVRKIEIVDRSAKTLLTSSFGTAHNARVLVRRGLSEFRDSTLSRHKGLLKTAKRIAKALKATGEA